ncbi:MAG: hypothetical protein KIT24_09120 [Phycisphaeraceae bacterium]|nr:hypothetical protein [Phycisphaeraceae bacterium]
MLKPYAVACLAALGAKASGTCELFLPSNAACRDHLQRLGLPNWYGGNADASIAVRDTNLVAQQLTDRPGTFSDEAIAVLCQQLDLSVGVAQGLATHLDEVILNALTHSDSPVGCFVVGQAFPTKQTVEITVLDLGQTIRGHLTSNPKHEGITTDREAILSATEEGVTGTVVHNRWGEVNSGIGLFELRKYCESGGGKMAILSGGNYLTFGSENSASAHRFNGHFAGCLVNIQFFAR